MRQSARRDESSPDRAADTSPPRSPVSHLTPPVERLALRLDEVAASLGIGRRTLERMRSAGAFPRPDLHIGRAPLWRPETIRRWVDGGGA